MQLSGALSKNKMMLSVTKNEKTLDDIEAKMTSCEERVDAIEQAARARLKLLTEAQLAEIDEQWETCLKYAKKLKSLMGKLRSDCKKLSGDYSRKWDGYERKAQRLRKIAEKARDDLIKRKKFRK